MAERSSDPKSLDLGKLLDPKRVNFEIKSGRVRRVREDAPGCGASSRTRRTRPDYMTAAFPFKRQPVRWMCLFRLHPPVGQR